MSPQAIYFLNMRKLFMRLFLFSLSIVLILIALPNHAQAENQASPVDTRFIEGRDYIIIDTPTDNSSPSILSANKIDSSIQSGRVYDSIVFGFNLPIQTSQEAEKRITAQYNWYARHPEYMQRVWQRAEPYMYYIKTELNKRSMPLELALLPIIESAFDPFAYSHGRASGMWQFIPGTAKMFKVKQNWWYDGRRDVIDSTQAALEYLERLQRMFDGNWLHAIAAYNSGPGNVRKGIRRNKQKNKPTDFWSLGLPRETQAYVPKLIALKRIFQERLFYSHLNPIADHAYFAEVNTGSQIDLATAAQLANIDLDKLYQLNPGFNRWATAPKGPHRLLVPIASEYTFRQKIKQLPDSERIQVTRYKIKSGDVLGTIARQSGITVSALKELNNLNTNNIRAGKYLLIPKASTDISAYTKTQAARLSTTQNRKRSGTKISHTVVNGDSFWTLAKKYKTTTRALASWNAMAPRDTLRIGQKLIIWDKHKTQLDTSTSTTRKVFYKVRKGDSISTIAAKFRVSIKQVKHWNAQSLAKYLQPGQTLVLHIDVLKQSGG